MEFSTLGELSVNGKGSYGIAASAVPYSKELYTYLRITDITDDGRINFNGLKSVDDVNAKKYKLKPNDIVFARTEVREEIIFMMDMMGSLYMQDFL